jgi:hypothetical protein
MEVRIQNLLDLGMEKAKSSARLSGGVSLDELKAIAYCLDLARTQSKPNLDDAVFAKVENQQNLDVILHNNQKNEVGEGNYRKDRTHFLACATF